MKLVSRLFSWKSFFYGREKPVQIVIPNDETEIDIDCEVATIISSKKSVSRKYAREKGIQFQDIVN